MEYNECARIPYMMDEGKYKKIFKKEKMYNYNCGYKYEYEPYTYSPRQPKQPHQPVQYQAYSKFEKALEAKRGGNLNDETVWELLKSGYFCFWDVDECIKFVGDFMYLAPYEIDISRIVISYGLINEEKEGIAIRFTESNFEIDIVKKGEPFLHGHNVNYQNKSLFEENAK